MKRIDWLFIIILFIVGLNPVSANDDFKIKKAACQKVFSDLKKAKGLLEGRPPYLHVLPNLDSLNTDPNRKLVMAIAYPNGNIYLDVMTYDVCKDLMGDDWENGLAFILAHELAHFTKEHNWRHEFVEKQVSRDQVPDALVSAPEVMIMGEKTVEQIKEAYNKAAGKYNIMHNEAEADLEAGFMSYLAGYKPKKAGPKFLDESYRVFEITESGGNYVSKDQRKEIITQTGAKLDSLISVFEAGNFASMIGEHDIALDCYDYVAKNYESKEILNNMGVIGLLQIKDMIHIDSLPYYNLPITLDMDLANRGYQGARGTESDEERAARLHYERQIKILNRSISYFDRSMQMDEEYHIPALNKSVAYYFMQNIKRLTPKHATYQKDDLFFAKAAALRAMQKLELSEKSEEDKKSARIDINNQLLILSHMQNDAKEIALYTGAIEKLSEVGSPAQMNIRYIKTGVSDLKEHLRKKVKSGNECAALYEEARAEAEDNGTSTDNIIDTRTEMLFKNDEKKGRAIHEEVHKINRAQKWNSLVVGDRNRVTRTLYYYNDDSKNYSMYYFIEKAPNKDDLVKTSKELWFFATAEDYAYKAHCASIGDDEMSMTKAYGFPEKELKTNRGALRYYEGHVVELKKKNGIIFQTSNGKVDRFVISKLQLN